MPSKESFINLRKFLGREFQYHLKEQYWMWPVQEGRLVATIFRALYDKKSLPFSHHISEIRSLLLISVHKIAATPKGRAHDIKAFKLSDKMRCTIWAIRMRVFYTKEFVPQYWNFLNISRIQYQNILRNFLRSFDELRVYTKVH